MPEFFKEGWKPLSQDWFKEGSVGRTAYLLTQDVLEGRLRPPSILNRPVGWFYNRNPRNKTARDLEVLGLRTISDVVDLPTTDLDELLKDQKLASDLKRRLLTDFREFLVVLPHSRFLAEFALGGSQAYPVPVEYEPAIMKAVEDHFDITPESVDWRGRKIGRQIVGLLLGLDDGIPKTQVQVGNIFDLSPTAIGSYFRGTMRRLRVPSLVDQMGTVGRDKEIKYEHMLRERHQLLVGLVPLPPDCFARTVYGVNIMGEIPSGLERTIFGRSDFEDFINNLSHSTRLELEEHWPLLKGRLIIPFVTQDLSQVPLTRQTREEIVNALRRTIIIDGELPKRETKPSEPVTKKPSQPKVDDPGSRERWYKLRERLNRELDERRRGKDLAGMFKVWQMIQSAQRLNLTTVDEIHQFIIRTHRGERIVGHTPSHWVIKAAIQYLLDQAGKLGDQEEK